MITRDIKTNMFYEPERMGDDTYMLELAQRYPYAATMHSHHCALCCKTIEHTRLEALRTGDKAAHMCCGRDVRAS